MEKLNNSKFAEDVVQSADILAAPIISSGIHKKDTAKSKPVEKPTPAKKQPVTYVMVKGEMIEPVEIIKPGSDDVINKLLSPFTAGKHHCRYEKLFECKELLTTEVHHYNYNGKTLLLAKGSKLEITGKNSSPWMRDKKEPVDALGGLIVIGAKVTVNKLTGYSLIVRKDCEIGDLESSQIYKGSNPFGESAECFEVDWDFGWGNNYANSIEPLKIGTLKKSSIINSRVNSSENAFGSIEDCVIVNSSVNKANMLKMCNINNSSLAADSINIEYNSFNKAHIACKQLNANKRSYKEIRDFSIRLTDTVIDISNRLDYGTISNGVTSLNYVTKVGYDKPAGILIEHYTGEKNYVEFNKHHTYMEIRQKVETILGIKKPEIPAPIPGQYNPYYSPLSPNFNPVEESLIKALVDAIESRVNVIDMVRSVNEVTAY